MPRRELLGPPEPSISGMAMARAGTDSQEDQVGISRLSQVGPPVPPSYPRRELSGRGKDKERGLSKAYRNFAIGGHLADWATTMDFADTPEMESNGLLRPMLRSPGGLALLKAGYGQGLYTLGALIHKEGVKKDDKVLRAVGKLVPVLGGLLGYQAALHNSVNTPALNSPID